MVLAANGFLSHSQTLWAQSVLTVFLKILETQNPGSSMALTLSATEVAWIVYMILPHCRHCPPHLTVEKGLLLECLQVGQMGTDVGKDLVDLGLAVCTGAEAYIHRLVCLGTCLSSRVQHCFCCVDIHPPKVNGTNENCIHQVAMRNGDSPSGRSPYEDLVPQRVVTNLLVLCGQYSTA